MRPEAQRLLDELDAGEKHLIGDRVVSCLACADSGAVVSVDMADKPDYRGLDTAIETTVVPCPYCSAGSRRAASEAAIETYDCSHNWTEDAAFQPGLFTCTKCGLQARLGLQRLPDDR